MFTAATVMKILVCENMHSFLSKGTITNPVFRSKQRIGWLYTKMMLLLLLLLFLTLVLNSQGRKIMLCKEKIRKQAGMVFTPTPPSQNYQEVLLLLLLLLLFIFYYITTVTIVTF